VRLRKAHPCGGTDWRVVRLGADIGLRCLACGRRVLLERPVLEKRLKQFVSRGDPVSVEGVPARAGSGPGPGQDVEPPGQEGPPAR
jgi:hypothetical protein